MLLTVPHLNTDFQMTWGLLSPFAATVEQVTFTELVQA